MDNKDIFKQFEDYMLKNIKDIDPEIAKATSKIDFWDLLAGDEKAQLSGEPDTKDITKE